MLALVLLCLVAGCSASKANSTRHGYCTEHTFARNSSLMHFTKEPVPVEYAYQDKFKSIHCCVKGSVSIEWFKDGSPYPWSAGVSNLILYPEASNQTLYTRKAARSDSGNYTCRLSNQTHSETHTMRLDVLEKPTDAPKMMYISSDQWVEEGARLRLFCEALIGRSYLADARSDLRWRKVWPNGTEGDLLDSQTQVKTTREDMEGILGSYLMIDSVSAQDYGTYVCVIHSNNVPSNHYVTVHYTFSTAPSTWSSTRVPWRWLLLCFLGLVALVASAAALYRRCSARLLLAARAARARRATPAQRARVLEKEFDVLVCFTAVDGELVRGALLHTLAHKYNYRVHGVQLSATPDSWYEEVICECARARSWIAVLSPAQLTPAQLVTSLRQLRAARPRAVVLLQDLPKLKVEAKEAGESVVSLLRGTRLLPWRHVHDKQFWTSLRLALPLPPTTTREQRVNNVETDENKSRSGSLTALV